jgi:hypothetical protein
LAAFRRWNTATWAGQSAIPARRFDRGNVRHYRLCAPSRGTRAAVSALNFLRRRIDLPILGQRLRLKTVPPIWLESEDGNC